MDFNIIKDWLELLSYAATVVGIPLAIYIYYNDTVKERKIKEKEILFLNYNLYVDYLKLCLENPELEIYISGGIKHEFSDKERRELIIFEIFFTYLECAYLYYADMSDEIRRKRWDGWVNYVKEFSQYKNFRKAWELTNGQWDEDFMKFMNVLMKQETGN